MAVVARRSRLEARRIRQGYTQESLAEAVDVVRLTVRRWEEGESTPRPRQRRPLAQALDVSLGELDRLLVPDGHDDNVDRRSFIAGVAGATLAPLGTSTPVPPEIVGYLNQQLAAHWQADRALGPHLLLDHVVSQARTVTRAVDATTGTLHRDLLQLATAYTGLVAWLYQDIGDLRTCNTWLGETLELGHRSGDPQLVAYALTCKAMVRVDSNDGVGAVDLATAALATTKSLGAKARAMALQQAAHGYALLGDRPAVDRLLDELGQILEDLASDRHPWGGDRLRRNPSDVLDVQRATYYERLGLADESARLWARVMRQPSHERRDRGVHLARHAIALVDAGNPAEAADRAAEGARYLAATGSARMRHEFMRLRDKASAWASTPEGHNLAEVLQTIA